MKTVADFLHNKWNASATIYASAGVPWNYVIHSEKYWKLSLTYRNISHMCSIFFCYPIVFSGAAHCRESFHRSRTLQLWTDWKVAEEGKTFAIHTRSFWRWQCFYISLVYVIFTKIAIICSNFTSCEKGFLSLGFYDLYSRTTSRPTQEHGNICKHYKSS